MDGKIPTVKREALGWPGVEEARGTSGSVALRYGQYEIGQLDLDDGLADLPVPEELRDDLLPRGRAVPRRAGSEGRASYPVESDEDVAVVLELLGRNYDRARDAAGSGIMYGHGEEQESAVARRSSYLAGVRRDRKTRV